MTIPHILGGAAAACIAWYIVTSIRIYEALRRKDIRVSFLWLRALAPVYA